MEKPQHMDAYIRETANALREIVAEIELKPATTRNRYGDYMGLITKLNERRHAPLFWSACLIKAGANAQGVRDALQVLGHSI
jgi:hypothetical protein